MFVRIIKISGKQVTVSLDDDADLLRVSKYASESQPLAELLISDGRAITIKQRKRIYAMLSDISNWSGYSRDETKQVMKYEFITKTGYEMFSLSNVSESTATQFIKYLINFCFSFNVPYKMRTVDLLHENDYFQYMCIIHRKCVICGEHAQIDHIYPIGMGRNRQMLDNRQFVFEALCPKHHQIKHAEYSPNEWVAKYHIVPIKLDSNDIRKLHIGG